MCTYMNELMKLKMRYVCGWDPVNQLLKLALLL